MSVKLSDLIPEDEKPLLMHKLANLEQYCSSAGCYEARKPKHPKYPQSRYCVEHAKVAKMRAEERGMYRFK